MAKILIIGAGSAIAEATARRWAIRGDALYLVDRDAERLGAVAGDLRVRGGSVAGQAVLDVNDFAAHAKVLDAAAAALGGLDLAFIAHGTLGDQAAGEADPAVALKELSTNALSVVSLGTLLANRFEAQGWGCLAVISSVAGDRGRQSNYVYGTAKATVTAFLSGLRNRLYRSGVRVLTIKPGMVDTPMTASFKKGPLFASAETVAAGIVRAVDEKKDVVYVPGYWRLVMAVIKALPEAVFKRLKL
jgi:decaprenylphospho-beta-D-erythro-pentofuranosid-2-ulose 2-reductase